MKPKTMEEVLAELEKARKESAELRLELQQAKRVQGVLLAAGIITSKRLDQANALAGSFKDLWE